MGRPPGRGLARAIRILVEPLYVPLYPNPEDWSWFLARAASRALLAAGLWGLGHAVGLDIQDPELTEVTYSLNALLEALDHINPPGLATVEPLPILLPPR